MKLVFDASAIVATLALYGGEAVSLLRGQATLTLAKYEIGNAVWKELARSRVSVDEARSKLARLATVLGLMDIRDLEAGGELAEVLEVAARLKLTFYDASYLHLAKRLGAALVTEDGELAGKAVELGVKVRAARDLRAA